MHAARLSPDEQHRRADYYERIGTHHMTPLWEVLGALVPPQPRSPVQPYLWRYAELRKQVVNEERNWSMARSIGNMERLLAAHGIAMTFPQERNIIRLKAAEPDEPAQYACQAVPSLRD